MEQTSAGWILVICTAMPLLGGAIGWLIRGKSNKAVTRKLVADASLTETNSFKAYIDLYKQMADNLKIELQGALKEAQDLRHDLHEIKLELNFYIAENSELKMRLSQKSNV